MGIDSKEILINIRKAVVYSVRAWFRSLSGHPFLWVMVFCCLLVYRFLPSVFAFFLSSAPVIVCTAVLLGTLLSLGQSNIPKAEEDKRSQNISTLKSVGVADNFVEEKDRSFSAETHVVKRREEKAIKEDKEICGEERGLENEKITGSRLEVGDKQIEGLFVDSRRPSSWKESEGQDESSDSVSDSDSAESSSPDASMTDIMPMLDELHPLLDANPPKPAHKSSEDFEESSQSHESDNASEGSAEEGENQEEEAQEDPEDQVVGVVTWTEDDEKNLKDIKTSELERNRKMENLIAKRIATKNQKAMAEGNLIDLDSIPMQIPAVSTARRNPFDLPYNSDDIIGLPPIPGSAPSVLLPRMNPFDLPYDQAIGGGRGVMGVNVSHQGFSTIPHREIFFRRHESFTLGTSFPAEIKQEKQESSRLKPFFVLERTGSEETSSSLQRQMSEKSDSKMSSVAEADTISSVADQDNVEVLGHEGSHLEEKLVLPEGENVEEILSESSEEVDSVDIEQEQTEINLNDSEVSFKGVGEVEINPKVELEVVDHKYGGGSSSSSLSEGHGTVNLEMSEDDPSKWSTESIPSAMAEVEQVEEVQTIGPVYDSSPSAMENLSNRAVLEEALLYEEKGGPSSAPSVVVDTKLDMQERSIPLMAVVGPKTISANGSFHKEIGYTSEEFWAVPPSLAAVDEDESKSKEVTEISEQDVIQVGLSGVQVTIAKPVILASGPEQALHVARSSSLNTEENHNESQANLNELVYEPVDENSSKISEMEAEFVEHQSTRDLTGFNDSTEVEKKSIKEDVELMEGIKEIDEGLVSELDVIGDFNMEGGNKIINVDGVTSSSVETGVQGNFLDVGFFKLDEVKGEVGATKPQQPEECSSEQEVLEVRSLEDFNSVFKQTEVEKLVLSEEELVATRSIEDPSSTLKHFNKGDIDKPVVLEQLVESEVRPVELEEREIHTEPIINEVKSFETIELSVEESAIQETGLSTENCSALKSNEEVKENTGSSSMEGPTAEKSTEKVKEAFDNLGSKRKDKKKAKPSISSSSSSSSSSSDSD